MGGCLSSSSATQVDHQDSTANVVGVNGDLREYPLPMTVSQVLLMEPTCNPCFVCNSDRLYYDDFIPALKPDEELQSGQIYFVLPTTKLQYRLNASDMAALAVKASVALNTSAKKNRKKKNKGRISPMADQANQRLGYPDSDVDGLLMKKKSSDRSPAPAKPLGVSRSGSVRKLQRYSSRRAKLAVRSFRLKLTTIYEGTVLQFY